MPLTNSATHRIIAIAPLGNSRGRTLAAFGNALRRHGRAIQRLQWTVVLVYVVLVTVPAFLPLPPERAGILDHLTRLAQFAFWGIWWPFVILSVMVLGRVWCGFLCPEGALSEWASRHGAGRRMPYWLKWSGWPFVAFLATTVYGQLVSVYEYPKPALVVLGGSTLGAMAIGALYGRGKRLWCRHLCPVSGVFAILARVAPFHFRVDRKAWAGSKAPAAPINCAPLVHLKSMRGAADCHMCARCSGHKDAIFLAGRSPGGELVAMPAHEAPAWHARLLVWGMLGVAFGAFAWSSSRDLVAVKQWIATKLVEYGFLDPLAAVGRWWLLTHYPETNDVFSFLDGAMIVGYVASIALLIGSWCTFWLALAEKSLRLPRARYALALTFTPFAGLAIFLGLLGVTAGQLGAEGFSLAWLPGLRTLLLVLGAVWSVALAILWIERQAATRWQRLGAKAATLVSLAIPLGFWLVPLRLA